MPTLLFYAGRIRISWNTQSDYNLWIRFAKRYRLLQVLECLPAFPMREENKTLCQRRMVFEALIDLKRYDQYMPVRWVYGYRAFLRDRRDQFFVPRETRFPPTC